MFSTLREITSKGLVAIVSCTNIRVVLGLTDGGGDIDKGLYAPGFGIFIVRLGRSVKTLCPVSSILLSGRAGLFDLIPYIQLIFCSFHII